jgi:hypothetical protein
MNGPDSPFDKAAPMPSLEQPVWYALRPEIRSHPLRLSDLKRLAAQQQLRHEDFIWHPAWETWRPAHELSGLFPNAANGVPPSPAAKAPLPHAVQGQSDPRSTKDNFKERARHELRAYVVITVYAWTILSLLRLHEALLADSYHVGLQAHGRTIVTALILGKVVLIAEALRFGERTARRAPGFAILIKSIIFAFAILLFHAAEHIATALWHGEAFRAELLLIDIAQVRRSLIMTAIITIALMPYFLIKEIERRTGERDLLLMAVGLRR